MCPWAILYCFSDYMHTTLCLPKEKRFTTITVAGHSEGALIGMLACQNRPKVKGYISIAGAGRPAYKRLCIHARRCITRTIYKILQLFFDKISSSLTAHQTEHDFKFTAGTERP